eukprot:CAMPEP_0181128212 /NCGR_PEP_ID=MMETSP1071-20121207/28626_1 /TAXON_ID=35127 /ORGANISM="Thalassiosira sp., Strain NH16" /LENGTH=66 /DNA_ID=CAMNT_0023214033 /DNA_START=74 /DNA_END=271 /DNA_ORIENTATION=+
MPSNNKSATRRLPSRAPSTPLLLPPLRLLKLLLATALLAPPSSTLIMVVSATVTLSETGHQYHSRP